MRPSRRRHRVQARHRHHEPPRHRCRLPRADPRGGRPRDGFVGGLFDAVGSCRAFERIQGRLDRRGSRRGAGRLCLVQDSEDSRHAERRADGEPAQGARSLTLSSISGKSRHRPGLLGIKGVRTAQQDMYDFIGQARSIVYSPNMWQLLEGYAAFDDLDLPSDRFARWHPLNQSLYVGYKVMLAGLLLLGKGDRIAMNSSVETRYPLLDEDVISFCASIAPEYKLNGLKDKWLLRQVAARTLPPRIANRPKTMFQASRADAFLDDDRPAWVDQLLSPESLRRRAGSTPRPWRTSVQPRSAFRDSRPGGSSWT